MSGLHLKPDYNPSVILLSIGVSFIGAYITIGYCEQFRLGRACKYGTKFLSRPVQLLCMACSLGGIAIWCMHFVGMSSLHLRYPDGSPVAIRYFLFPTLLSAFVVVLFALAGLYVASLDIMFGKTKAEIVELYVSQAIKGSIQQIRHTSTAKMIFIIATQSPWHLICGGIIAGSGVSVMHYVGMWGLLFTDGHIKWDAGIIAASVLIAIIASTAAFWILFRLLSVYPDKEFLRVLSAIIMAIAVCGMHYTGMMAASFEYELGGQSTALPTMDVSFTRENAFVGSLLASVLLGFLLMMLGDAEHRALIFHQTVDLRNHENLVKYLEGDERYSTLMHRWSPVLHGEKSVFSDSETKRRSVRMSARVYAAAPPSSLTPIEERAKASPIFIQSVSNNDSIDLPVSTGEPTDLYNRSNDQIQDEIPQEKV